MKRAIVIGVLLLCSACIQLGSDPLPLRYYLLQSNAEAEPIPLQKDVVVTLAPVRFPAYLDRLQLTTYDEQHQILLANLDRWSEPLQESFTRVLTENLALHLQKEQGANQASRAMDKEGFLVTLLINRFDGMLGHQTSVDIRWTITKTGLKEKSLQGHFVENTPIGASYPELVQGLNNALDNLSTLLAQQVAGFESH